MPEEILLIGSGAMGEAILQGLARAGENPERIRVAEARSERLADLVERYGIKPFRENSEAARAEVIILAVKPKDALTALGEYGPHLGLGQSVVSIVAGLPLKTLAAALPPTVPAARAMPNTPARIGAGVTAVAYAAAMPPGARERIRVILGAIGRVVEVPETAMDAVTAVSGSGPAYVFYLLEAWLAAAADLGLPPEVGRILVAETLRGSLGLWEVSGEEPADLRRAVTSPGGTTEAALRVLDGAGFNGTFREALAAAASRSAELG